MCSAGMDKNMNVEVLSCKIHFYHLSLLDQSAEPAVIGSLLNPNPAVISNLDLTVMDQFDVVIAKTTYLEKPKYVSNEVSIVTVV